MKVLQTMQTVCLLLNFRIFFGDQLIFYNSWPKDRCFLHRLALLFFMICIPLQMLFKQLMYAEFVAQSYDFYHKSNYGFSVNILHYTSLLHSFTCTFFSFKYFTSISDR